MKKEAEVQKELSDWLTDSFPVEVHWAEDFEENTDYNTFTVENSSGKRTIAIEVKNGDDSSNVYDGIVELNDYLKDMLNNDPKYLVEGEEKKPEVFLLAAQHSIEGQLFKEEREPERRDFLRKYHKRSNVESSFNVMKEKFGKNLRCKDSTALETEVFTKVLCYNICILIRMMYKLDLELNSF